MTARERQENLLQWGRNLTVAEGLLHITWSKHVLLLQWGRNLTVAEGAARDLVAATP